MEKQKAILLAIVENEYFNEKIDELKKLCATINIEVTHVFTQNMSERKIGLLGKGKLEEIVDQDLKYDVVITYQSCTPLDIRVLKETFDVDVLDKMRVILQIFAMRAQSRLAKMEVELAASLLERDELVGSYQGYSRQAGASGSTSSRGSGEQQLQVDRRRVNQKIGRLKKDIEKEKRKQTISKKRQQQQNLFTVALVGYTNAGKSTLTNTLLEMSNPIKAHKQVLSENQVFSSLDTTTRRIEIDNIPPFLLVDTVGFVMDLPTELIASFNSTLSIIQEADVVIEVLDGSYDLSMQIDSIEKYTNNIEAHKKIVVINKKDQLKKNHTPYLSISAKTKENISQLLDKIKEKRLETMEFSQGYVHPSRVFEFYQYPDDVFVVNRKDNPMSVFVKVYINDRTQHLKQLLKANEEDCIHFH